MAKGIGLIGNFKGKVGNMVGYKLTDSNTGNSQGIRVYQPIVRNPKTSAQAEQRAKLAPINATYRALKMVIDRGNEGLPYGNKSRLAWLKKAFKPEYMPWFEKGAIITDPVICQVTVGSLPNMIFTVDDSSILISAENVTAETGVATIGAVSTALKAAYPFLKDGDQITFVYLSRENDALQSEVFSFVIDTTSTEATSRFNALAGSLSFAATLDGGSGTVIISREGDNGAHLRSSSFLKLWGDLVDEGVYDPERKTQVIPSYQNSASANADWAEESIQ